MHIQPSGELAFFVLIFGVIAMTSFFLYDQYRENKKNKHNKG